jgi:hypothetical protein
MFPSQLFSSHVFPAQVFSRPALSVVTSFPVRGNMETVASCTGGLRQKTYRDLLLSPPLGSSPWEHYSGLITHDPGTTLVLRDDFAKLDTVASTGKWLSTKGTGGTLALANKACGVINIPTAASASDYLVLSTQEPIFKLANYNPIVFEGYFNLTEAATNAASWFFGLTSVLTAGWIQTSGVPPTSYSGLMFYKATGALLLKVQSSNGTTQSTPVTAATVVSGQSYILGAKIDPNDGVTALITYYVSTVTGSPPVRTLVSTGTVNLTLASLANMYLAFGVMCGSGGTAETLSADYVQAFQNRVLF